MHVINLAFNQFLSFPLAQSRKILLVISLLLVGQAGWSLENFATQAGRTQIEFGHYGFYTNSNYDDNGVLKYLPSNAQFLGLYGYGDIAFDVTDGWMIGLGGDGGYVKSNDGFYDRTSIYMSQVRLNTQYLFRNSVIWIAPQIEVIFPFAGVPFETDDVLISENSQTQTGKINLFKAWTRFFHTYGYFGYTARSEGRSHYIPVGLGTRFSITPLWFGFEVNASKTVINDDLTTQARYRNNVINRVDGGSNKYFSINPEYTNLGGYIQWPVDRSLSFKVAANATVQGKSYSQDFGWLASVTYAFGGHVDDPSYLPLLYQEESKQELRRKRLRKFKMKGVKENPALFQEEDLRQED